MGHAVSYEVPARGREQIEQIVGCQMIDGACVTHQPRRSEPRRVGCPFVDALLQDGSPPPPAAARSGPRPAR